MHETLHDLAQQHDLNARQTQALWRLAGVHQPPAHVHQHLRQALALAAALLLGAGLIFWVAANWDVQTRTFKLHVLQVAVAGPLLAALLLPATRRTARIALALLGMLALGGLLAYIGITYQTGADAWQLFATWAALSLPMVLVLRSDWMWALWLLIVATAIGSWSGQALINHLGNLLSWRSSRNLLTPLMWLLVFAWPLLLDRLGLVRDMQGRLAWPVISLRLVALLAIGAWAGHGVFYVLSDWEARRFWLWVNPGFVYNLLLVLFAAWVGWRSRWRDLVVLALAVLALDVLGLTLLARWLFANLSSQGEGVIFLFAAMAATVVGLSGRWLHHQQQAFRAHEQEGADHGA